MRTWRIAVFEVYQSSKEGDSEYMHWMSFGTDKSYSSPIQNTPRMGEATAREDITAVIDEDMEDTGVSGAEDKIGKGAQEEPRGHQYATCEDTGGW